MMTEQICVSWWMVYLKMEIQRSLVSFQRNGLEVTFVEMMNVEGGSGWVPAQEKVPKQVSDLDQEIESDLTRPRLNCNLLSLGRLASLGHLQEPWYDPLDR